jgi:hypothetical protein
MGLNLCLNAVDRLYRFEQGAGPGSFDQVLAAHAEAKNGMVGDLSHAPSFRCRTTR